MPLPIITLGGLYDGLGTPWSTHVAADVAPYGWHVIKAPGLLGRSMNAWVGDCWHYVAEQIKRLLGSLRTPFGIVGHSAGAPVALDVADNVIGCRAVGYCSGLVPREVTHRKDWSQVSVACIHVRGELDQLKDGTRACHGMMAEHNCESLTIRPIPQPVDVARPHLLGLAPHLQELCELFAHAALRLEFER